MDILLYANNYQENTSVLTMFDNQEEAKRVFIQGKRKAKGTTSELGIVDSFFANPFGPVQRQEQSLAIIDRVFDSLFTKEIPVGQIYTKLGISGFERKGPEEAAEELFKWLKNK